MIDKIVPKTAVIGADGFLGVNFFKSCRDLYPDCVGTLISNLDLIKPDIGPFSLAKSAHQEALILAGITKIVECQNDPPGTRKINVSGTLELIRQLVQEGIKPVFFSSDHVFDGKKGSYAEDSAVNPLTEYGKQKAEVESGIKELTRGNYLVVRLSKVFSTGGKDGTLLNQMAGTLLRGETIRAAYDQLFCPTFVNDVVAAVKWAQGERVSGIINVCSPESWSRYDLAVTLAKKLGVDAVRVEKATLDEVTAGIKYPKNTTMVSKVLPRNRITFKPIMECIDEVVQKCKER